MRIISKWLVWFAKYTRWQVSGWQSIQRTLAPLKKRATVVINSSVSICALSAERWCLRNSSQRGARLSCVSCFDQTLVAVNHCLDGPATDDGLAGGGAHRSAEERLT